MGKNHAEVLEYIHNFRVLAILKIVLGGIIS